MLLVNIGGAPCTDTVSGEAGLYSAGHVPDDGRADTRWSGYKR